MKFFSILMLSCIFMFSACKGDKGDVGPSGVSGLNGTNGSNGTNGKDGNANVKSNTYTVLPGNWLPNTATSSSGYFFSIAAADITADIAARGAVLAYLQTSTGDWLAMPWTTFYSSYSKLYNYAYGTGFFQPQTKDSDLNSYRPTSNFTFKVVTIAAGSVKPNVDTKDYEAVSRAYNLRAVEAAQKQKLASKTSAIDGH